MAKVKVPFGERYRTSKAIFRESMAVLRKNRDLWVFPILAGVAMLLMFAVTVVPSWYMVQGSWGTSAIPPFWLPLAMLPLVYPFTLAMSLLQAALSFALHERMARRKCTRREAWTRAVGQLGPIARFNFIAMLVAGVLAIIGQILTKLRIVPYLGQVVETLGTFGWAVASFFVIPILVVQGETSSTGALRASVQLARKQWGKSVAGLVTIGLVILVPYLIVAGVFLFLVLPAAMAILFNVHASPAAVMGWMMGLMLGFLILPMLLFMPLQIGANTAYQTGLYRYATTGKVPTGFSRETLADAWKPYQQA